MNVYSIKNVLKMMNYLKENLDFKNQFKKAFLKKKI
jgi:hypothetical protein